MNLFETTFDWLASHLLDIYQITLLFVVPAVALTYILLYSYERRKNKRLEWYRKKISDNIEKATREKEEN